MLENLVHPCREDYLLIAVSIVMDVQTYILILYNYEWILNKIHPSKCQIQPGDRSLTGRRGGDRRVGLCYAMLLGGLQSTLFYMLQDGGGQKRSLRQD